MSNIDGVTPSDARGIGNIAHRQVEKDLAAAALEDAVDELIEFCYEDGFYSIEALPNGSGMRGPNTHRCDLLRKAVLDLLNKPATAPVPVQADNGLLVVHNPDVRL